MPKAALKSSACRRTRNTLFMRRPKVTARASSSFSRNTNRTAWNCRPFVLKPADRVIAGQVMKEDDKPASGVNVQLNGEDQPDGQLTTDSKGRFHFQVCEGQIRLFANSQNGGGNAQATAEAGDTNVVMTLSSQSGRLPPDAASRLAQRQSAARFGGGESCRRRRARRPAGVAVPVRRRPASVAARRPPVG